VTRAIAVREARSGDVPAIRAVAAASWRATYAELLDAAEIERVLRDAYAPARVGTLIDRAAHDARSSFLVAERDGRVAGYLHFADHPEHGPYLHRIYVAPADVGAGVGTALLRALHARLGAGAAYTLDVMPGNARARAFYARWGAKEVGRQAPPFELLLRIAVPGGAQAAPSASTPPET